MDLFLVPIVKGEARALPPTIVIVPQHRLLRLDRARRIDLPHFPVAFLPLARDPRPPRSLPPRIGSRRVVQYRGVPHRLPAGRKVDRSGLAVVITLFRVSKVGVSPASKYAVVIFVLVQAAVGTVVVVTAGGDQEIVRQREDSPGAPDIPVEAFRFFPVGVHENFAGFDEHRCGHARRQKEVPVVGLFREISWDVTLEKQGGPVGGRERARRGGGFVSGLWRWGEGGLFGRFESRRLSRFVGRRGTFSVVVLILVVDFFFLGGACRRRVRGGGRGHLRGHLRGLLRRCGRGLVGRRGSCGGIGWGKGGRNRSRRLGHFHHNHFLLLLTARLAPRAIVRRRSGLADTPGCAIAVFRSEPGHGCDHDDGQDQDGDRDEEVYYAPPLLPPRLAFDRGYRP
mmetsp:Transcript_16070/g.46259  ORF Transcript_16070/g.46259 Transcript_16070/m.46259 type:complete len:397 (-) Transcript_16070:194-1384(-)